MLAFMMSCHVVLCRVVLWRFVFDCLFVFFLSFILWNLRCRRCEDKQRVVSTAADLTAAVSFRFACLLVVAHWCSCLVLSCYFIPFHSAGGSISMYPMPLSEEQLLATFDTYDSLIKDCRLIKSALSSAPFLPSFLLFPPSVACVCLYVCCAARIRGMEC